MAFFDVVLVILVIQISLSSSNEVNPKKPVLENISEFYLLITPLLSVLDIRFSRFWIKWWVSFIGSLARAKGVSYY